MEIQSRIETFLAGRAQDKYTNVTLGKQMGKKIYKNCIGYLLSMVNNLSFAVKS